MHFYTYVNLFVVYKFETVPTILCFHSQSQMFSLHNESAHREVHAAGLSAVKQVTTTSWCADHVEGIVVIFMGERTEDTGHCSF